MKIQKCKYCGNNNFILEPRVTGQDVMTADMVALKCKDCGKWLKWCPKDERILYYKKPKTKWEKLKEFIDKYANNYDEGISSICCLILDKIQELEKEYDLL